MTTDPDSRRKRRALYIAIPIILIIFALVIAVSIWGGEEATEAPGEGAATELAEPGE